MRAAAKFYHQTRDFIGTVTQRSMMGTRSVTQWGAWRIVGAHDTRVQAEAALAARTKRLGAEDQAVFHKGKRLGTEANP